MKILVSTTKNVILASLIASSSIGVSHAQSTDEKVKAYVDQFITDEPQKIEVENERSWPYRFWSVDSTLANTGNGLKKDNIAIGLRWDVENMGSWGLSVSQKNSYTNNEEKVAYFRQLKVVDFPLAGGIDLQGVLGHTRAPLLKLAEKSTRFFVPAQSIDGVYFDVEKPGGYRVFGAIGETGQLGSAYGGIGFEGSGKKATSFGIEAPINNLFKRSSAGIQILRVSDSLAGSQEWSVMPVINGENSGIKWQAQAVLNSRKDASPFGIWGYGEYAEGAKKYDFGMFHFEPGLKWGEMALQENAQGWYLRYSEQNKRWGLNANIEQLQTLSDHVITSYAQVGGRYQYDVKTNISGMAAVRTGASPGWQAQGSVDTSTDVGSIRGQVDVGRWSGESRWQIGTEYTPRLDSDFKLSGGLTFGLSNAQGKVQKWQSVGLSSGIDFDDLRFEGSFKSTFWSDRTRTDSAQISSTWQINQEWSLAAAFNMQRGGQEKDWNLSPIQQLAAIDKKTTSFWLTLRYQDSVGESAKQSASGTAEVIVFFDENNNGRQDAGERGAKNVLVTMDERSSVQTDEVVHAVFFGVPVGTHQFRVSPNEVPLPWQLVDSGIKNSNVEVREKVRISIPLSK